jgi:CubicO group peptidase (beta-lactamase class C family)
VLLCLGIHGQMVYVNPAAGVVAAKVSSWPSPQDAVALFATIAAFDAVAAAVAPA